MGVLAEAMQEGSWVILDELNLAPTEVHEALNRVLDDNRELFIPETKETIKARSELFIPETKETIKARSGLGYSVIVQGLE